MAPMLQYAIESGSTQMQSLIPEFLATKAGEQAVMEGLAAQQEGKPGLLDLLTKAASYGSDAVKVAGAVSTVMTKGVGLRSIQLARAGRLDEAEKLVGTLKANAKLFGVEPKAMQGVTDKMIGVLKSGGQQAAIDGLKQESPRCWG